MTDLKPSICCPNPSCSAPLNAMGATVCENCQTPLIYRYLWAQGKRAEQSPPGTQISGRYYVTSPQVWLDTQPGLMPDIPTDLPDEALAYLHLYPFRLHLPEVYGFCLEAEESSSVSAILLENAPLDGFGNVLPSIASAWAQATAVRQVYWLWQMVQLWTPLLEQGVASSLLAGNNIRVEGWRIRLCQLYSDRDVLPSTPPPETEAVPEIGLADLANLWLGWLSTAKPALVESLQSICEQMRSGTAELKAIETQLNQLLLEQSCRLPLHLQAVGITDAGNQRSHNEDACYPVMTDSKVADGVAPNLLIVCDGIGGHEGGEVASQTAVRSLKLQVQALLTEVTEHPELASPAIVAEQLESIVRVVNNLIASQNDTQGREARRRMGTTLVMALQLPQRVPTVTGSSGNSHELYLVTVGDSRAYWMTQRYCHQLTVDDDVAAREVKMGRSLYRESLQRPDAGALTQALGTRDADFLHPHIQRFLLEEDGLLLLCSDGLSDNNLVEQLWVERHEELFKGKTPLEGIAHNWLEQANQRNGHDNVSIVLLLCRVSSPLPDLSLPRTSGSQGVSSTWSPASQALVSEGADGTPVDSATTPTQRSRLNPLLVLTGLLAVLLLAAGIGLVIWSQRDQAGFQQFRQRILPNPSQPR